MKKLFLFLCAAAIIPFFVIAQAQDQSQNQNLPERQDNQILGGNMGMPENLVRLGDLKSMQFIGGQGEDQGSVDDVVLTADGRISHFIANVRNYSQLQDGRYLIPFEYVEFVRRSPSGATGMEGAAGSGTANSAGSGSTTSTASGSTTSSEATSSTSGGAAGSDQSTTSSVAGVDQAQGDASMQANQVSVGTQTALRLDITDMANIEALAQDIQPTKIAKDSVLLSSLRDYKVINNQNEDLKGRIDDVVADKQNGKIQYVAFTFGGTLGIGGNTVAVPYQDVWYNKTDKSVRLDVGADRVDQLKGFSSNQWPAQADPNWRNAEGSQNLGSGKQTGPTGTTSTAGTSDKAGTTSTAGSAETGSTTGAESGASTTTSSQGAAGSGAGSTTSTSSGASGGPTY